MYKQIKSVICNLVLEDFWVHRACRQDILYAKKLVKWVGI